VRARAKALAGAIAVAFGVTAVGLAHAQQAKPAAKQPAKQGAKAPAKPVEMVREQRALDILKATSARLAAAKSMSFRALVTYEYPSQLGPAIAYTTASEVNMVRPDKLRVITIGDGPASEFYFDGKTITAFTPAENLVAVAAAPGNVDAALKFAYDTAGLYFPFTDLLVADPYKAIAEDIKLAFYIGQSKIVGGVTTDMVAIANDNVFVQLWIGAEDKLPRRMRAIYRADPQRLRHQLDLDGWQLDGAIPTELFASARAASAAKIEFAKPKVPNVPPGVKPMAKPAKPAAAKPQ
jgi:hypothetical protein